MTRSGWLAIIHECSTCGRKVRGPSFWRHAKRCHQFDMFKGTV